LGKETRWEKNKPKLKTWLKGELGKKGEKSLPEKSNWVAGGVKTTTEKNAKTDKQKKLPCLRKGPGEGKNA